MERLPASTDLAEREQIIEVFDYINRLLVGSPQREKFQHYAQSLLRPTFAALDWQPKASEPSSAGTLRASLIRALGDSNDSEIIAGCRERFERYLTDPASLTPDLRPAVLSVVGRYASEKTWNKLHELGLKTTSIADKQNYYNALAQATDQTLINKTLAIALTDELPTSRAVFLVARVARDSGHPEIDRRFDAANMKTLLTKTDAAGANRYAPSLFMFFSADSRANELKIYAQANLPAATSPDVAKAVDAIPFRAEFKNRLINLSRIWLAQKEL